ncbi:hypothetical protein Cantr_06651 [Candida viswanathii]|uniref:Zn(2)-C6 fungal-type domain-containing protein n=1 Tax=Candida viswanathii TaxID=5486 RepID=A0A367XVU0_9ASCO|nr:hypothetical protein Cantr_06651 [Candida viswanathii]
MGPTILKIEESPKSISKVSKPKRQRSRVPVSCLSCKKRKVKCDKGKPACGGCIRNGVGHLCEYIYPHWVDKGQNGLASSPAGAALQSPVKIEQTNEYKALKTQNEKVISNQRKEIEDLKRQLLVVQQLSPPRDAQGNDLAGSDRSYLASGVSVLGKLSPLTNHSLAKMEVLDEYNIKPNYGGKSHASVDNLDIYSWVNIIKLDPQLTTLWFKITNLQKMYHMYKINKLKNGGDPVKTLPQKKSASASPPGKINEIDFTHAFLDSLPNIQPQQNTNNDHKCPVIECDFNLIIEDISSPRQSPKKGPARSKQCPEGALQQQETGDDEECPEKAQGDAGEQQGALKCPMFKNDIINKSKSLQYKLQSLFDSILNLSRGCNLNYNQMIFLIDFYYRSDVFDSKVLLLFYRQDILDVVQKGMTGEVLLNLPKGLYEDIYYQLKVSGIYLSMLATIVETSLCYLRNSLRNGDCDEVAPTFRSQFPHELAYLGLGSRQTNIYFICEDLLASGDMSFDSLSCVTLYMAFLNKIIIEYKSPGGLFTEPKSSFTNLFTNLLETVFAPNSHLEIWKDPELVEFGTPQKKSVKALRMHLCHLWSNLIRISNIATFNFIPIVKSSPRLDGLLQKMFSKIAVVDLWQYHLKYLTSVGENQLIITLHVHYLIAGMYSALRFGILNIGIPKLTVSNLDFIIKQCSTWLQDVGLDRVPEVRKLEIVYMLSYSRLFLMYILLLQGEELHNDALLEHMVLPDIVSRLNQFIDLLKNGNHQSLYIFLALSEMMTRTIQIVIAILTRIKSKNSAFKSHQALYEEQIGKVTKEVSSVLEFLQSITPNRSNERLTKLSKLWKFYLTFVNSSNNESKAVNYAKLHAGVPEFQAKTCPVLDSSMNSTPASSGMNNEFTRCPISHLTTPMTEEEGNGKGDLTGSRSSTLNGFSSSYTSNPKRRKCPFDHTAMMKRAPAYPSAVESNMREYKTFSPSPLGSSVPITSPMVRNSENTEILQSIPASTPPPRQFPLPSMLSQSRLQQSLSLMPMPQLDMDVRSTASSISMFAPDDLELFNQFGDFDLDFLHNENLLDHIGNNNSIKMESSSSSNNNIESFFQ